MDEPLRSLGQEIAPPAALEERVRRTLADRGLLRRRRPHVWRWVGPMAAAAVLLVIGYVAGHSRRENTTQPEEGMRYALFLYEDAAFETSRPEAELVAEYSAWAAVLHERGQLESGEQLSMTGQVLERRADSIDVAARDVVADAGILTGLFVIRAASESEALSIARTCPHLKYGGRVAVRAIIET